jgi:hypothetical protein
MTKILNSKNSNIGNTERIIPEFQQLARVTERGWGRRTVRFAAWLPSAILLVTWGTDIQF